MNKNNIIIVTILLALSFSIGRYCSPEKVKTEIKTVEVEKIVKKVEHKVITIRQNKDGSKDTTIVVDSNTDQKTHSNSSTINKEITTKEIKTNVSLLIGGTHSISPLNYGISIQRSFIGPITIGAWALTNANYGVSIGLNF